MRKDFSFAEVESFDEHIRTSIPGYDTLFETNVRLATRFARDGYTVVDVGCSSARLLEAVRNSLQSRRPQVEYIGLDSEREFEAAWQKRRANNLTLMTSDIRAYDYRNLSLAFSVFTIQFLPEPDKLPLLRRVFDGLVPGGALFIAEKTLAVSARLQELITTQYHQFKLGSFTSDEILEKDQRLFGLMTLWTEQEIQENLRSVGFSDVQAIWKTSNFVEYIALK